MCILIFKAAANPKANEFALILINNRDEQYNRPTETSHFWKQFPKVIGGRDAFPGKEGGTWLGMTKAGKIGVLLNILQPPDQENPDAKGRGHLVTNYLCSNVDGKTYLNDIVREGHLYNNFRLVTIEVRPSFEEFLIGTVNNLNGDPPTYLPSGTYGMGNTDATPWRKVTFGRDKFVEIVDEHRTIDTKEKLVEDLLKLLDNDSRNFPDPTLEKQGRGKGHGFVEKLSAIKVCAPEYKYGTRTNSIILIDGKGNVDYVERTMEEPIDPYDPKWIVIRHAFQLES